MSMSPTSNRNKPWSIILGMLHLAAAVALLSLFSTRQLEKALEPHSCWSHCFVVIIFKETTRKRKLMEYKVHILSKSYPQKI